MANQNTFKIIVVGDGGVGKSCFLKRHLIGRFDNQYHATIGVEIQPLRFRFDPNLNDFNDRSQFQILFNCWDCAGQAQFGGLGVQGYGIQAQGAIVMFDLTSMASYRNVNRWILEIRQHCGNIPIVVCGNKIDERDIKIHDQHKRSLYEIDSVVAYYDISCKTNYNFEEPFLCLARKFMGFEGEGEEGEV